MTETHSTTRSAKVEGLLIEPERLGLVTDLYELTMAAGYWSAGLGDRQATFDLFYRELPPRRSYMVAAGLEQAVHYLLNLRFTDEDIQYLKKLPVFAQVPSGWFDALRRLRFTGEASAIPEGTVVFPGEPLMRITAPLMQAQIAETYLLTSLAYQTSVATKAARLLTAARGRGVVDFGTRRAHGPQAGFLAARASFIGGCSGTSNVAAAERLGIPPVGTMAHSWVMTIEDELKAFEQFAAVFSDRPTFLIDTYDTVEGARNATRCSIRPGAVRLDSGDLAELARQVRQVLDEAGRHDVTIFASGDLNEYKINALVSAGAPIDAFGVGTELTTVADAPSLGCVYKLVDVAGGSDHSGRIKLSSGKRTYPGQKQVFRQVGPDGKFLSDTIGLVSECLPGEPLLQSIVSNGQLVRSLPSLAQVQQYCRRQLERLPKQLLLLDGQATYPVAISKTLQAEFDQLANLKKESLPG